MTLAPFSWREPVDQPQSRDVLKIGGIVSHQRQVVNQRDGTDHEIHPTYRDSLLEQLAPHPTEFLCAVRIEVQHRDIG